jgi:hypothetical protein
VAFEKSGYYHSGRKKKTSLYEIPFMKTSSTLPIDLKEFKLKGIQAYM